MNIYLIGYRGSGKSSLAPRVAEILGWPSFDCDNEIELLVGKTIAEIFAEGGEAVFREWETTIIQAMAQKSGCVIALGGGAPTVKTNQEIVRRSGVSVWLQADAQTLCERISSDEKSATQRPNLTAESGLKEVQKMLFLRHDAYTACADYTIDTEGLPPQQIAIQIASWWNRADKN